MTPLDSRIDEDFVARFYRGEPFVFEGQLEDIDGAVEALAGRTFWGCIMAADGTRLHEVVADVLSDRNGAGYYRGVFDGAVSDDCFGKAGLIWSQGEHVAGLGRKIHAQGSLIIYPGPGSQAPDGDNGIAAIAHRLTRRVTSSGRSTVRISQQGARGPSPWDADGLTRQEYRDAIAREATETIRAEVIASLVPLVASGVAAGGETTIEAPAPVPDDAPDLATVIIGGIEQDAGEHFTSDGSTTLTLTFPLYEGARWKVKMFNRSLGE